MNNNNLETSVDILSKKVASLEKKHYNDNLEVQTGLQDLTDSFVNLGITSVSYDETSKTLNIQG